MKEDKETYIADLKAFFEANPIPRGFRIEDGWISDPRLFLDKHFYELEANWGKKPTAVVVERMNATRRAIKFYYARLKSEARKGITVEQSEHRGYLKVIGAPTSLEAYLAASDHCAAMGDSVAWHKLTTQIDEGIFPAPDGSYYFAFDTLMQPWN